MSAAPAAGREDLVIERQLAHPIEKVWRALTESALLQEWMLDNDFVARVGHRFRLRGPARSDWNGVLEGEVLIVQPHRCLAYTCNATGEQAAGGLRTIVTWTLGAREGGTWLRLHQAGFRADQMQQYERAVMAWRQELDGLERVCATLQ